MGSRNRSFGRLRWVVVAAALTLVACDSVEERVDAHHARGLELAQEGEPEKAILEFRNALRLNEAFVPARFELSKLLEEQQEFRSVVGHLLKVVEIDPEHVAARRKLAQIMLVAGDLDSALTHSEAAYLVAPNDPEVLAMRAMVAINSDNLPLAKTSAERAVAIDPTNSSAVLALSAYYVALEELAEAQRVLDEAIARGQDALPLYLAKLQVLVQAGDEAKLGPFLEDVTATFPDEVGFRRALIAWYLQEEAFERAEGAMRALVAAEPNDLVAVFDLVRFVSEREGAAAGRAELSDWIAQRPGVYPLQAALAEFDYQNDAQSEAKGLLRSVVAQGGENANAARIQLARYLLREDRVDEAAALLDQVLTEDTRNVDALVQRAGMRIDGGDLQDAILDLRTALNESPQNADLLALTALAYERDGSPELARDSLGAAVRASGYRSDLVLRLADFLARSDQLQAMEVVLTEAAAQRPNDRAILSALASARLRLEMWSGATEVADRLRALDGSDRAADRILAAALGGQDRFDESITLLQRLKEDPQTSNSAMAALVGIYNRAGQAAEAEALLASILEEDPTNPQATLLQGALALQNNDPVAAEERLRTVIALLPDHHAGYDALAQLYMRQQRFQEADAILAGGLERTAEPDRLRLLRAMNYELMQEPDLAIAEYKVLFDRLPDSVLVANNLASLLSDHRGSDAESLALAVRAAKRLRNSREPAFQDTYGWIAYLQGDYPEALRSLREAVAALPDNPWVQYHTGMAYLALQQGEAARSHLEAALRLASPDFPPAETVRRALADLDSAEPSPGQ